MAEVEYRIEFKPRALRELEQLPNTERDRVWQKVLGLRWDLAGDVKRLTNFSPRFRLRVGNYRVLFDVEGTVITIYRIVNRRDAYR